MMRARKKCFLEDSTHLDRLLSDLFLGREIFQRERRIAFRPFLFLVTYFDLPTVFPSLRRFSFDSDRIGSARR
jgi:hypothetical protein